MGEGPGAPLAPVAGGHRGPRVPPTQPPAGLSPVPPQRGCHSLQWSAAVPAVRASSTPMVTATPSILSSLGPAAPLGPWARETCVSSVSSLLVSAAGGFLRPPALPHPSWHCQAPRAYLCARAWGTAHPPAPPPASPPPPRSCGRVKVTKDQLKVPEPMGVVGGCPRRTFLIILGARGGPCRLEALQSIPVHGKGCASKEPQTCPSSWKNDGVSSEGSRKV